MALCRAACFAGIEQPVQMHDEVAHMRIVDGTMSGVLPGVVGLGLVGIDADNVELLEIAELDSIERRQLAAEYEMKQLALARFSPRHTPAPVVLVQDPCNFA
jgi:hypothetical protein